MKVLILLTLLFNFACTKSTPVPTPLTSTQGAPIAFTPPAIQNPWFCYISGKSLLCQALEEIRYRRGQLETTFSRGTQLCWKDLVGAQGKGQIWFGCAGTSSCTGGHIFSSSTITVTPCDGTVQFIKGKEDVIPFGSIGIASVNVDNNNFEGITNRFTGLFAPPLVHAGTGVVVSCTDDACTVSLK